MVKITFDDKDETQDDSQDFLATFERVNGLQEFERYEDEEFWYWGVYEVDNFQVKLNKEWASYSVAGGGVLVYIFGKELDIRFRIFAGGGAPSVIEYVRDYPREVEIQCTDFIGVIPPMCILKMTNLTHFQIDGYESYHRGYLRLRFNDGVHVKQSLKTYATSEGATVIKELMKALDSIEQIVYN